MRSVQKQLEHHAKMRRSKATKAQEAAALFPAIMLLHDPQQLAEVPT